MRYRPEYYSDLSIAQKLKYEFRELKDRFKKLREKWAFKFELNVIIPIRRELSLLYLSVVFFVIKNKKYRYKKVLEAYKSNRSESRYVIFERSDGDILKVRISRHNPSNSDSSQIFMMVDNFSFSIFSKEKMLQRVRSERIHSHYSCLKNRL